MSLFKFDKVTKTETQEKKRMFKKGTENTNKEITTCYYIEISDKITVYNIDKTSYELYPKKSEYDISKICKFAKKHKYKVHYEIAQHGEHLKVTLERKNLNQPHIDFILTNGTELENNNINKKIRLEIKELDKNFINKPYIRENDFYTMIINREDLMNYELDANAMLFSNIEENSFVKIAGKQKKSEFLINYYKNM